MRSPSSPSSVRSASMTRFAVSWSPRRASPSNDAYLSFLRTDRDAAVTSEIESASAAFSRAVTGVTSPAITQGLPPPRGHHAIVGQRVGASTGNNNSGNNNSGNGNNNTARQQQQLRQQRQRWPPQGQRPWRQCRQRQCRQHQHHRQRPSTTRRPRTTAQETAGVATTFLSHESRTADDWLCDSGASSSMSGARSAFSSLKSDRRPIRLADGKVIYSEGLGSIRFLSDCGYIITIHNVLFVPLLAVSLFASNKFAREHHDTHSEVTDYPKRKWVNRQNGGHGIHRHDPLE
jgi:hypothetical protein